MSDISPETIERYARIGFELCEFGDECECCGAFGPLWFGDRDAFDSREGRHLCRRCLEERIEANAELSAQIDSREAVTRRYAWSRDGERYHGGFPSIEEAFADAEACNAEGPYIGALEPPAPGEAYIDAALVIDHIARQDDYDHDFADGWPNASSEQLDELTEALQKVIGEWLDRHKLRDTFFLVPDARQYVREDGQVVEWKGCDRNG